MRRDSPRHRRILLAHGVPHVLECRRVAWSARVSATKPPSCPFSQCSNDLVRQHLALVEVSALGIQVLLPVGAVLFLFEAPLLELRRRERLLLDSSHEPDPGRRDHADAGVCGSEPVLVDGEDTVHHLEVVGAHQAPLVLRLLQPGGAARQIIGARPCRGFGRPLLRSEGGIGQGRRSRRGCRIGVRRGCAAAQTDRAKPPQPQAVACKLGGRRPQRRCSCAEAAEEPHLEHCQEAHGFTARRWRSFSHFVVRLPALLPCGHRNLGAVRPEP
mmetsp:Transcript_115774/g.327443  ORF Transcript_115774/g.327443 Transcript_115774/m.327443 type:complete len:272 (+) Transcript_115774:669-1484(+)